MIQRTGRSASSDRMALSASPGHGRPGGVDVRHRDSGPRERQGREARVGEQAQDRARPLGEEPRHGRKVFREEPDLPGVRRAKLHGHARRGDRPGTAWRFAAAPASVTVVAERCLAPRGRIASLACGARRRSIHHTVTEPLEPTAAADIEQLVGRTVRHASMMTRREARGMMRVAAGGRTPRARLRHGPGTPVSQRRRDHGERRPATWAASSAG